MAEAQASLCLDIPDLQSCQALAAHIAMSGQQGDILALWGTLGAGKTAFARALIQAMGRLATPERLLTEVPSPTFTLVQQYETGNLRLGPEGLVSHFDLYRLSDPEEAWEIGIEDAFAQGLSLIEWPDRLQNLLPKERLDITLSFPETETDGVMPSEDRRQVTVSGPEGLTTRYFPAIKAFSL